MSSANQSSSLDSNSAFLPVTVSWNLLKDTYGNIKARLLPTTHVSGRFSEESHERVFFQRLSGEEITETFTETFVFFENKH